MDSSQLPVRHQHDVHAVMQIEEPVSVIILDLCSCHDAAADSPDDSNHTQSGCQLGSKQDVAAHAVLRSSKRVRVCAKHAAAILRSKQAWREALPNGPAYPVSWQLIVIISPAQVRNQFFTVKF